MTMTATTAADPDIQEMTLYEVRCALRVGYLAVRTVAPEAEEALVCRLEALEARKDELEAMLRRLNRKNF